MRSGRRVSSVLWCLFLQFVVCHIILVSSVCVKDVLPTTSHVRADGCEFSDIPPLRFGSVVESILLTRSYFKVNVVQFETPTTLNITIRDVTFASTFSLQCTSVSSAVQLHLLITNTSFLAGDLRIASCIFGRQSRLLIHDVHVARRTDEPGIHFRNVQLREASLFHLNKTWVEQGEVKLEETAFYSQSKMIVQDTTVNNNRRPYALWFIGRDPVDFGMGKGQIVCAFSTLAFSEESSLEIRNSRMTSQKLPVFFDDRNGPAGTHTQQTCYSTLVRTFVQNVTILIDDRSVFTFPAEFPIRDAVVLHLVRYANLNRFYNDSVPYEPPSVRVFGVMAYAAEMNYYRGSTFSSLNAVTAEVGVRLESLELRNLQLIRNKTAEETEEGPIRWLHRLVASNPQMSLTATETLFSGAPIELRGVNGLRLALTACTIASFEVHDSVFATFDLLDLKGSLRKVIINHVTMSGNAILSFGGAFPSGSSVVIQQLTAVRLILRGSYRNASLIISGSRIGDSVGITRGTEPIIRLNGVSFHNNSIFCLSNSILSGVGRWLEVVADNAEYYTMGSGYHCYSNGYAFDTGSQLRLESVIFIGAGVHMLYFEKELGEKAGKDCYKWTTRSVMRDSKLVFSNVSVAYPRAVDVLIHRNVNLVFPAASSFLKGTFSFTGVTPSASSLNVEALRNVSLDAGRISLESIRVTTGAELLFELWREPVLSNVRLDGSPLVISGRTFTGCTMSNIQVQRVLFENCVSNLFTFTGYSALAPNGQVEFRNVRFGRLRFGGDLTRNALVSFIQLQRTAITVAGPMLVHNSSIVIEDGDLTASDSLEALRVDMIQFTHASILRVHNSTLRTTANRGSAIMLRGAGSVLTSRSSSGYTCLQDSFVFDAGSTFILNGSKLYFGQGGSPSTIIMEPSASSPADPKAGGCSTHIIKTVARNATMIFVNTGWSSGTSVLRFHSNAAGLVGFDSNYQVTPLQQPTTRVTIENAGTSVEIFMAEVGRFPSTSNQPILLDEPGQRNVSREEWEAKFASFSVGLGAVMMEWPSRETTSDNSSDERSTAAIDCGECCNAAQLLLFESTTSAPGMRTKTPTMLPGIPSSLFNRTRTLQEVPTASPTQIPTTTETPSTQAPTANATSVPSSAPSSTFTSTPARFQTRSLTFYNDASAQEEEFNVTSTPALVNVSPKSAPNPLKDAGLSSTEVRAVTATAYGGTVLAGAFSPTAANKATSAVRVMSVASCEALTSDAEDSSWPDEIQFLGAVPIGDHASVRGRRGLGAVLTTTLGIALVTALLFAPLRFASPTRPLRPLRWVAVLYALCLSYYGPNVTAVAIVVLRRFATTTGVVVVFLCMAVQGMCALVSFYLLRWKFDPRSIPSQMNHWSQPGTTVHPENDDGTKEATTSGGDTTMLTRLQIVLFPIYDPCRIINLGRTRLLMYEDILVAHVLAVLTGINPSTRSSCIGVAFAMALVSLAHLLYLLIIRPYRTTIEQGFAVCVAVLQVGLAVLVGVAITNPSTVRMIAWLLLLLDAVFYLQAGTLAFIEIYFAWKRMRTPEKGSSQQQSSRSSNVNATGGPGDLKVDEEEMTVLKVPSADGPATVNPLASREEAMVQRPLLSTPA